MGLARSTYYYSPQETKQKEDADIRDRMETLALRFPRYGYRRMTAHLQRAWIPYFIDQVYNQEQLHSAPGL